MKALFITLDKCPNIDAGAVRIHMFAKMLTDNKHEVTVISMGPYSDEKALKVEDVTYISFRLKKDTLINKVLAYIIFPFRLKKFLKNKNYDVCIHTQVDLITLRVLKRYVKMNHANIVYDAVEWFSPEQFKQGISSHTYKLNNNYNTYYLNGNHKAISISSYLYNNFKMRGIDTMLLPVVLDVKNTSHKKMKIGRGKQKTIIYAGTPGKKDYLDVILKGLILLRDDERKQLNFRIIGCNRNQFMKSTSLGLDEIEQIEDSVEFVGRVARECVLHEYSKADFSIFIRSSKARYAQAGFPTKFVESLSTATPVVCNYTSDLECYIKHFENGIVVKGEDEYACLEALRSIIKLDRVSITEMQKNARYTAEKYFDYNIFSDKLVQFIKG